jgi:hypothetical protein
VGHFPCEGTLYESAGSGHLYFFSHSFAQIFQGTLTAAVVRGAGGLPGARANSGNQDLLRRIYFQMYELSKRILAKIFHFQFASLQ